MLRILRWIATLPDAVSAYAVIAAAGTLVYDFKLALCPSYEVASKEFGKVCVAPWFPALEATLEIAFGAIAGFLVVVLPTRIAPAEKRMVAWVAFAVGVFVGLAAAMTRIPTP